MELSLYHTFAHKSRFLKEFHKFSCLYRYIKSGRALTLPLSVILHHREIKLAAVVQGMLSYPELELTGLYDEIHIGIAEGQRRSLQPEGDLLLFPENALRAGEDIFLDDMTPDELSNALGVPTAPSSATGEGFICSVLGVEHHANY